MNLEYPTCPKCRKPARDVYEVLLITTALVRHKDGTFDWEEEQSEPDWDCSETQLDTFGRARVRCCNGHEWSTRITPTEETGS